VALIRSCHIGWTEGNSRSLHYAALRSHGKRGRRDDNFVLKLEVFARKVNKVKASEPRYIWTSETGAGRPCKRVLASARRSLCPSYSLSFNQALHSVPHLITDGPHFVLR
jgi:hypothetical protein